MSFPSSEDRQAEDQISIIKNAVKNMTNDAKYGSYTNFLRELTRIESAASKIQSRLPGIPSSPQKYKTILVPYDGSSFSKNALSEALEVAKAFNSKLFILTVIETASDVPPGVLNDIISKKINKLKRDVSMPSRFKTTTKLQHKIDEYKKQGIDFEFEANVGRAADSILKFAKQNRIELIIIGSKGLRGMKKLAALGSVSRRVSEEAKCPVMITR